MQSNSAISKRLPLIQEADLNGKVVLVRFDHNVVKKGVIKDPFRIDKTIGTLYYIVDRGGRPILMTHVGRPRDRKTGKITCSPDESVEPIVDYLERKLNTEFFIPECEIDPELGISGIGNSVYRAIGDLKDRKIGGIYLPNTRWFRGEEGEGFFRDNFAVNLSDLADVYINDAFGSWQPHVSTFDITKFIPSYAGFLMQQEIENLNYVINPDRPFLAVIAGSKYDTKIGPLYAIYNKADHLILGGVLYNAYLCAKYGISIRGIPEQDIRAAKELVKTDEERQKIIELPYVVESDIMEGKVEGRYRTVSLDNFKEGDQYGYILDIDPKSFANEKVTEAILNASTIFVNAVMGFTPHFTAGSRALDETIDKNSMALKMYGGGDTLQEFKNLCPGLYLSILDSSRYYFFTGGGTVLTAIEQGSPYGLRPVQALMENKVRAGKITS
ncbi:MAG TPA: phosphoglycerate kinase [Nitrospirae bacterium]|nr:phosphoglycerate kinase [Nitrospirota bacterium]HDZ02546.1 phosphoglycerate kinase [Nitrospirota bacterium]